MPRLFRLAFLLLLTASAACSSDEKVSVGDPVDVVPTAPKLKSIDPDTGKAGDPVTITGTDLGDGAASVLWFGAKKAKTDSWTAGKITAKVPAGAGDEVFVEVNGLKSNVLAFTLDTGGTGNNPPGGNPPPSGGGGVPTGTLQGTIFASNAATVPAARVMIAADAAFSQGVQTVSAGINGVYALTLYEGSYFVKASKDVNGNGIYFEVGVDEIGWAGRFAVTANGLTVGDVTLDPLASSTITGRIVDADASWGAAVTGVVSWDLGAGAARYKAAMTKGDFVVPEVAGTAVGVVSYRDLNGNGVYDANVEPAVTVSNNTVAPSAGLTKTFPAKRTITGTLANAAGWTIYAQDRVNVDPAGRRFNVGTQVLDATGNFTITGLATTYRLRAFLDLNGNGVPDGNEPRMTVSPADMNVTAGDPAPVSLVLDPQIDWVSTKVVADANADGRLSPGETGKLQITVTNLGGTATSLAALASAANNVTVYGASALPASLAYGQTAVFTVNVTAATVPAGEQIEVVVDVSAANGYTNNFSVFAGLFAQAPYTFTTFSGVYVDISGDPNAKVLGNAQNDQNSEYVDVRAGQGYFTGSNFKFPFYGMWITDGAIQAFGNGMADGFDVGDNGYLNFLNAADRLPIAIPSVAQDAQFVLAPQWVDYTPGQVHALVTGTAPNRVLTIQWKNVSPKTAPATQLSFQVKLYETTGVIEIIYGATATVTGQSVGINYGDGSTYLTWTPSISSAVRLTPNL